MNPPARPAPVTSTTAGPATAAPAGPPPATPLRVAQALDASQQAGLGLAQPLDSQLLLQGRRELQILHQGEIYRLQQTRQGKLILTK